MVIYYNYSNLAIGFKIETKKLTQNQFQKLKSKTNSQKIWHQPIYLVIVLDTQRLKLNWNELTWNQLKDDLNRSIFNWGHLIYTYSNFVHMAYNIMTWG